MKVTPFRGESSVEKIADKLYSGLTPAAKKKAVTALLKTNPQLEQIGSLKAGTLLRIPEIPRIKLKKNAGSGDPVAGVASTLSRSLEEYARILSERNAQFESRMKEQASLLKRKEVKNAVDSSPQMKRFVSSALDAGKTGLAAVKSNEKRLLAAIKKIQDSLSSDGD